LKRADLIPGKIIPVGLISQRAAGWRLMGKTIAFTDGIFSSINAGHLSSLSLAAAEADLLIVGLNADSSVKKLKGGDFMAQDQDARALQLASLLMVDGVVIFEEETPLALIKLLLPDVLIKTGDAKQEVVGAKEVRAAGGRVVINPPPPE
jgi:rfaE bifunctional protein nucleotidyltransferase chain/domain